MVPVAFVPRMCRRAAAPNARAAHMVMDVSGPIGTTHIAHADFTLPAGAPSHLPAFTLVDLLPRGLGLLDLCADWRTFSQAARSSDRVVIAMAISAAPLVVVKLVDVDPALPRLQ